MSKVYLRIAGVWQNVPKGYPDLDNALRCVYQLWQNRLQIVESGDVGFEIISDDGSSLNEDEIFHLIRSRPDLQRPPSMY